MTKKNKYVKVTTSPSNYSQNGFSEANVTSASAKVTSASAKVTRGEDKIKARKQLEEEIAHSHNVKASVLSASKDENRSRNNVEIKKSNPTPLPKDNNTYRTSTQNTRKPNTTGSKPITYKSTPNTNNGGNKPITNAQRGTQNSFRTSTETTAKVNTTKANYQSKSAKVTKVANNSGNFITKPTKSTGISTGGFKVNIKNPLSQMQKVSIRGNEFANTVVNKSISAMGRDDSLSNQTITGTMQATVVGVRGVKVAYNAYGTVYNATANSVIKVGKVAYKAGAVAVNKAVIPVAKTSFQLAKGGAKAVRAIDSTIGMIKAGHIPLNGATVKFIATKYAKNTGKFIVNGVKPIGVSIKKGFKAGVQKFTISKVGAKVVKSAKFVKSSAIKSYKFSKATGNVAIKIGKTGFKTIRSIDSTIGLIKAGHLSLAKAMIKRGFVQSGQALVKGLKETGKGVVWVSKNFKPAIATVKTFKAIKYRGQAVYKLARAGFRAIRSIDSTIGLIRVGILKFNPRTMINASKIAFSQVKPYFKGGFKLAFRDMKSLSKIMQKGGRKVTSISRTMFKPLKPVGRGFKLLDRPSAMLGGALLGSEDAGAQALGLAVSSVHYTYHGTRFVGKTLKATSKGVGRVGKVGFRGVTGGFKSIKKFNTIRKTQGWRKAFGKGFRSIGNKIANNIAKAGGSAVSAIINGITKLGTKAIIPILLLFLLIGNFNNIASGASAVVGAIFSPFYSNADDYSEQDETVFLQGQISSYRTEWVNDLNAEIRKKLKSHSSEGAWFASYDHDAAKFYYRYPEDSLDEIYQGRVTYIASTWSISHLLWSDEDVLKYIQPIYHSIIVSEYDLNPWKYQQKDLFKQIWNAMFSYTTESLPLSYCGQFTGADGHEYYPVEADGKCHADPLDCVHMTSKQWHTADADFDIVCSCDTIYYTCLGHQGIRNCGITAHSHSSSCESEGSYLSCGTLPHSHTTACMEFYNGSFTGNYKCGKTAHTHSDSCYTTYTYYSCGYSEHSHTAWSSASSPGCYSTSYHTGHLASACTNSEQHKSCSGYYECLGHTVYKVLLDIGKFDTLLYKYYLKDINRLEAKVTAGTITDAEREELAKLKDYYELCLEYKQSLIDEGLATP